MATTEQRNLQRFYRHQRIQKKIVGTSQRPRLYVFRSLNNFAAQIVDDNSGKVLFGMSTLAKEIRTKTKQRGNLKAAEALGEVFAQEAKKRGYSAVSFDRSGYVYHGRVKAFAEAARKGGLNF